MKRLMKRSGPWCTGDAGRVGPRGRPRRVGRGGLTDLTAVVGRAGRAGLTAALGLLGLLGLTPAVSAALAAPDVVETTHIEWLSLPPVWVLVLVILPLLVAACRWLYRREPWSGGLRWLPAALRFAALALLLAFLFHPVRSRQRVRVERPVAAVLVDDSASMREHDLGELAARLGLPKDAERRQLVAATLEQSLLRLGRDYDLLLYSFGSSLRALGGLDDLAAADGETRLGDALSALAADTRGRELNQVVLLTDGRVNAGRDPLASLAALSARQVPVSVIGVGDPRVPRDVRIANVTSPEVALAGDTVNFEVSVAERGFAGEPSSLVVRDSNSGEELARTEFRLGGEAGQSDSTEQLQRVSFVPRVEGDVDLRLEVAVMPGEADPSNNVERRLLRVEPGRIKVLYVDGYPRYEYRFLKDSLLRVENMEVQCFLVSASEDFIQESTPGVPSLATLPSSLEYLLKHYHVIILGDVHPQDLGADYEQFMADVKAFVEAGGGFLMIAGDRSAPREYAGTDIADILPVIIGDHDVEMGNVVEPGRPFRPRLTRPRDPQEIVSLLPDVEQNQQLWEGDSGLAPLTWYYPVAKVRATAEAVLVHPESRNAFGPHVILASMYMPQGRTAFLGTDETWRWRFRFLETYREPFWRGLIRYLALNRLRRSDYRFALSTELTEYAIGQRIGLTARVRDEGFEPLLADAFDVTSVTPEGRREVLSLPREAPGVFSGSLLATETGPYRFWLVDPEDPAATPRSPRSVTVVRPSLETDDVVLDELLLQRIAARTGGRYEPLENAGSLLASFDDPPRERPLDEPEREEIWAGFPQLALLVGLLAAEWILRKRRNLV